MKKVNRARTFSVRGVAGPRSGRPVGVRRHRGALGHRPSTSVSRRGSEHRRRQGDVLLSLLLDSVQLLVEAEDVGGRERRVVRLDGGGAPRRVRRRDDHAGRSGRVRRRDPPRRRVGRRVPRPVGALRSRGVKRTAVRRARPGNVTTIVVFTWLQWRRLHGARGYVPLPLLQMAGHGGHRE